jgi:hypothetical protein
MTAVSGLQYGVGARYACAIPLDDVGKPDVPVGTNAPVPYVGMPFYGFHAWDVKAPGMKQIDHKDNDGVAVSDFLPPDAGATAQLKIGVDNQPLNAFLGATKEITIGESKAVHWITNKQGSEPDVALFLYQQAKDRTTRARTWRWQIARSTICVPQLKGMDESAQEVLYDVVLNKGVTTIFGVPLTEAADGCLESAILGGMSNNKPCIAFWRMDGTDDVAMDFPTGVVAKAAANVSVYSWVTGALVSPTLYDVDVDLMGITWDAFPAAGIYGAFIEYV